MVRLMPLRPHRPRRRALVVGAGIAGLLTARVLADTFAEVEVVEQDVLPTTPVQRPGVAQGHHVHGLTARGAEVMERLFPGLGAELATAGAPGGDFGQIVAFRFPDCWSPRIPTGIPLQTFSRPLLETHLRHRLTALDRIRIRIRDGVRVTGLTGSPTHVTGVRVRTRPAADLLARLTPVSSVRTYAHCANQRTHYHRLPHWPGGLLALGDAVCAFNPLYGQGMGIAAVAADLLHTMLARHTHPCEGDFTRAYQRRLARLTHRPWMMSTLQDRGWQPDPTSDRAARATGALLPVVQQAMADNPEVFRRFLAAMHMTRSSAVLLHPRAVLPVVATAIRPGRATADAPHLWWGHTPHTPTEPGTPTPQAPPPPRTP
ncbi:hypothetical protein AOB60_03825 [Streptomyces noursei]|uniref:FAD-binding domain-containing protein n=2 Tax=Streptomyces noursei TaxID=1971 RepID=A0A2N8PGL3_STRNR|nr:hypothetical protein AOB60_03825 [Streptomyces noursei]